MSFFPWKLKALVCDSTITDTDVLGDQSSWETDPEFSGKGIDGKICLVSLPTTKSF